MKESKFIVFDEGDSEEVINGRIKKLEQDNWEVVEHKVAACKSTIAVSKVISFLLQRDKN
jgi:hypothetical protein